MSLQQTEYRPTLQAPHDPVLGTLYASALHTVLDLNVITDPAAGPEGTRFLRAGGDYPEPWTRDAAINAWNGVSTIAPRTARDTLLMVCAPLPDGSPALAQDNQWWDRIIWVPAAWNHYLATGDRDVLVTARDVGARSLDILHRHHFRPDIGLYAGGAVMQDGISGYPTPPNDPDVSSSFVGDYPAASEIMCLSTNAVYVGALRALAVMERELAGRSGPSGDRAAAFDERADLLSTAIDQHLWLKDAQTYGYFLHGAGALRGTVDRHQEALGIALLALLGGGDESSRVRGALTTLPRTARGAVNVWPHFPDRYDDERPGRHNAMCWPMVMGMLTRAAAHTGDLALTDATLAELEALIGGSGGRYFELYDPATGLPDGGWQVGTHWESVPDQTWSATAMVSAVHHGVLGARFSVGGLRFEPVVPERLAGLELRGLPYRCALLDVETRGSGARLAGIRLDGSAVDPEAPVHVSARLEGRHRVVLEVA